MTDNKSALTDLQLQADPDGSVRIRNLNTSRAIVASVEVVASINFQLRAVQSNSAINFSPQSFEIRIPSGLRKRVGYAWFTRPMDNLAEQRVELEYTIRGARYVSDEPIPLPDPSQVQDYLFLLTWQAGQTAYHFVNMNHEFGIDCEIRVETTGQGAHLRLDPNRHMDNWAGGPNVHFQILHPTFYVIPGD